jgi:hypothetical protein
MERQHRQMADHQRRFKLGGLELRDKELTAAQQRENEIKST